MKWAIVADSSCDLINPDFSNDDIGFVSVPLKINIGTKEFVDDENIDIVAMLDEMKHSKAASSSACPSPDSFAKAYEKADNVICVTITSGLSGTYNCACVARDMVKDEHPDKNIVVIDSKKTAGAMVLIIRRAVELIKNGMSFEDISANLAEYAESVRVIFSLSCFDNLVKNGRMNPIIGILATKLGIRAVAKDKDGKIEVVRKPRGEDKAAAEMIELIGQHGDYTDKPIIINHCMNMPMAQKCAKLIKDLLHTTDITIMECRGLTSFYAMNEGIIIGY